MNGSCVGWLVGVLVAVAVCVMTQPGFVVALFLGMGLSFMGMSLGRTLDR